MNVTYSDALLSADGLYRYSLERRWGDGLTVSWIMLNPSTAGVEEDDPTIRRVMEFSDSWGYAGIIVVNLFAFRASDPKDLQANTITRNVGVECDRQVGSALRHSDLAIAAWGTSPRSIVGGVRRVNEVVTMAANLDVDLYCLGMTADGSPRHPSPLGQVPMDTRPKIWRPAHA